MAETIGSSENAAAAVHDSRTADIADKFQPDYTPEQLENLGVYDSLYRGQGPRLASLGAWKPEWVSEHDPKGWAQWYKRYVSGRRIPDEDERQIKRWLNFKSRHGGPFTKNPTPRRGWALRNWGINPATLVPADQQQGITEMLDEYKNKAMQKHLAKQADLLPGISLQPHQQRIADEVTGENPQGSSRMLVYHGLGSGKSLSALAAAEAAKKKFGDSYGVVVPAALKGNFNKEIKKFTDSDPEVMSYTALGMGKQFKEPPQTLVMDEAHRLRNPGGAAAHAASQQAQSARNLLLLTGSPITNEPADLANLLALLHNGKMSPEQFNQRFVGHKTVNPGVINWFRGIKPGEQPEVKNESELRGLLKGHVDYQPSKNPKGVNVSEETIHVPLSPEQQKIQKAVRTKIPPGFLWKLDSEFPLSRDELAKLNSFMTGLRQVSMSTRPFRADKDPLKAYDQSSKLQAAMKNLQGTLESDPRKKAIIYSNHIDAGLAPYAAALKKNNIPHALFHGSISPTERQKAVDEYNAGKLRALLIGPAGAEGLSTRGTSLIQLLDPHWHESRSQQARGRGLRFDSHEGLPEDLKNVNVQRYLSSSEDPSWVGKLMGYTRERTGDEVLSRLAASKEMLNDKFRKILQEEGTQKASADIALTGARAWYKQALAPSPSILQFPGVQAKKRRKPKQPLMPPVSNNAIAGGVAAGAAALPLMSLHQDAFGSYNTLRERVRSVPLEHLQFPEEFARSGKVMHGDVATYFGEPQGWFAGKKPNLSKLTQGGEWTSGSGTYHGMLLRPHNGNVQVLEGGDAFPDTVPVAANGKYDSPFHRFIGQQAAAGKLPQRAAEQLLAAKGSPQYDKHLQDFEHTTSRNTFNKYYNAFTNATAAEQTGDAKGMSILGRMGHYLKRYGQQGKLLDQYKREAMTPEDASKVWDNLSDRDSNPMLVTRTPQMELLLKSPVPGVAAQARANVDTAFEKHYPMRSYNLGGAISAGARRLLFPKIAPTEQAVMADRSFLPPLPPPVCTEDYCVQPAARVLAHHGVPIGANPASVLPADLAANDGSTPVGMVIPTPGAKETASRGFITDPKNPEYPDYNNPANKPLLDKWKTDYRNRIINEWMPKSRNRRIVAGLLAAGAMGAAGYGATKLVQNLIKRRQESLAQAKAKEESAKRRKFMAAARKREMQRQTSADIAKAAAATYFQQMQS
jgi:superfamily II DNA or RNA helicase